MYKIILFLRRILCTIGYHRYIVAQELTNRSRRIACPYCHKSWGMNDDVRAVIPWDYELADLYNNMLGIELKYLPWEQSQPPIKTVKRQFND